MICFNHYFLKTFVDMIWRIFTYIVDKTRKRARRLIRFFLHVIWNTCSLCVEQCIEKGFMNFPINIYYFIKVSLVWAKHLDFRIKSHLTFQTEKWHSKAPSTDILDLNDKVWRALSLYYSWNFYPTVYNYTHTSA